MIGIYDVCLLLYGRAAIKPVTAVSRRVGGLMYALASEDAEDLIEVSDEPSCRVMLRSVDKQDISSPLFIIRASDYYVNRTELDRSGVEKLFHLFGRTGCGFGF